MPSRFRRGDLDIRPFPAVERDADPGALADAVRRWAEEQAEEAIRWYQRDKAIKRVGSRLLRAVSIVLVVVGGLIPLLSAASSGEFSNWGYVLLAGAAGCMGFDYFFGVSAGWMRDIATIQTLQRRLTEFRLAWTSAVVESSPVDQLALVRDLMGDVMAAVEAETADWLEEFRSNVGHLHGQTG